MVPYIWVRGLFRVRSKENPMSRTIEAGENTSPTWADVTDLITHLEQEHKCRIVVEMSRGSGKAPHLSVDCVAKRVRGRADWYTVQYTVGRWPSHSARTMPALLLRQLWQLSELLHNYDDLPLMRPLMPEAELPPPPAY